MKRFLLLGGLAILIMACSLSNGATLSAATLATPSAPLISPSPTPSPSPDICIVSAYYLNVRECASTACAVIDVLESGQPVTVIERGDWLKIETTGTGYINSTYCEIGE